MAVVAPVIINLDIYNFQIVIFQPLKMLEPEPGVLAR